MQLTQMSAKQSTLDKCKCPHFMILSHHGAFVFPIFLSVLSRSHLLMAWRRQRASNLFCEQAFCIEDAKEFCSRRNRSLSPLPKLIKPWSGSKSGHTQAFATIRATEMVLAALSLLDVKASYNGRRSNRGPLFCAKTQRRPMDLPLLRRIYMYVLPA